MAFSAQKSPHRSFSLSHSLFRPFSLTTLEEHFSTQRPSPLLLFSPFAAVSSMSLPFLVLACFPFLLTHAVYKRRSKRHNTTQLSCLQLFTHTHTHTHSHTHTHTHTHSHRHIQTHTHKHTHILSLLSALQHSHFLQKSPSQYSKRPILTSRRLSALGSATAQFCVARPTA